MALVDLARPPRGSRHDRKKDFGVDAWGKRRAGLTWLGQNLGVGT